MRNATSSSCCSSSPAGSQQVFGSQAPSHGCYSQLLLTSPRPMEEQVTPMPMPHALASLNVLLLAVYLLLFLLAKLFARLHLRAASRNTTRESDHGCDHRAESYGREIDAVDMTADIAGGQHQRTDTLFWFDEAVFEDSTLLGDEGKDHLYTSSTAARCLQVEASTFPCTEESTGHHISFSPREEDQYCDDDATAATGHHQEEAKDIAVVCATDDYVTATAPGQQNIPVAATVPENVSVQEKGSAVRGGEDGARPDDDDPREEEEEEKAAGRSEEHQVKLFVNSRVLADTKKLPLEGAVVGGGGGRYGEEEEEKERDRDRESSRFGASTLTSESTSKSSVEWQSSAAVTKDSDFSSSSRRSSARWESYTLFRKYDEDMVYFHRVGAQKLTETESFRSIKYQPRSMSARITQKLTPKPSAPIGLRDPYPDLERVYVAQICLTWEALNWNYTSFRRHNGGDGSDMMLEARCCPARVAQEFQQFQVLLYRFIENEPFEYGRRPEVYARMKNSSPKLLLVPEFREEEDEKDDLISAVQFLHILEESIRTFMTFLRADKRSHYQIFREMVKRKTTAEDQTLVITLKKANKKKKSRLKDLTRPRRCLKRTKLREEEEMWMLLGLIDLKVVARVLRMPEITDQQLHWCEEKMNRVRVDLQQGKMQRDPAPLFFPAH